MKKNITYRTALGCMIIMLFCCSVSAQYSKVSHSNNSDIHELDKRMNDYLELLELGYSEKEIFEDLGNVNFLTENFKTAAFWYQKLIDISDDDAISSNYLERYQYALQKAGITASTSMSESKDWLASIKEDYEIKNKLREPKFFTPVAGSFGGSGFEAHSGSEAIEQLVRQEIPTVINFKNKGEKPETQHAYRPPIAVTANGNTAYFTKAVYIKPKYGLFSERQLVHKIYRAERKNGRWKNVHEVAVCPKYFSAMHPAVSEDGKRLFFASDMPGTFGKYDIYVSAIHRDGTVGIAKNLGKKVNTTKNDLYPKLVGGSSLLFASEGHKGKGGLDVFAVTVADKKVGRSYNLGSPINSSKDDFSVEFIAKRGMGYVMSNRGNGKNAVSEVAFSYSKAKRNPLPDIKEESLLEVLNSESKTDYSSTIFEDQ